MVYLSTCLYPRELPLYYRRNRVSCYLFASQYMFILSNNVILKGLFIFSSVCHGNIVRLVDCFPPRILLA